MTTTAQLVRFDLIHPSDGADVVFSGSQVVAARALSNGQVVVAIADGSVNILSPQGDRFIVSATLQQQGNRSIAPSSLAIVQQGGQLQVLVSSQGSDTVSVFSANGQAPTTVIPIPTNNSQSNLSFTITFFTFSNSQGSSSASEAIRAATGLSLGNFSSLSSFVLIVTNESIIVAVEGNAYSTVAVLNFRSQLDDKSGDGRGRMPWLSLRYPVGDTSPVARLMIGVNEAIQQYRHRTAETQGTKDAETPRTTPRKDGSIPRQQPSRSPTRNPKEKAVPAASQPPADGSPNTKPRAAGANTKSDEQASLDSFWKQCPQVDPPILATTSAREGSKAEALAVLLAVVGQFRRTDNPVRQIERRTGLSALRNN